MNTKEQSAEMPPPSQSERGGNGRTSERRREQILEAARMVLTQAGFEKITTRRIAEAAGVNIATLHYYFGSKEGLLTETVRYARDRNARVLRSAMTAAPNACAALEQAFDALWTLVQERAGMIRYDLVVRGVRDENARREANGFYAAYYGLIEEVLERHAQEGGTLAAGIAPEAFIRYVVAAADGIVLHYLVERNDATTQAALSLLRRHAISLMQPAVPVEEDNGEGDATR